MYARFAMAAALVLTVSGSLAHGQNPDYPGYLGVYVAEGNGGMQITGFIADTPAEMLAMDGEISRNDTILSLNGHATRTLAQLKNARNSIEIGDEGKMVFRTSRGAIRHCWIGRTDPTATGRSRADNFTDVQDGDGGQVFSRPAP